MAEIVFYDYVSSNSVENLINKIAQIPSEEDVTIRINSGGGSVFAGRGLFREFSERKINLKIDGNASSMAFIWALYANEVSILNSTVALVHRASMSWNGDDSKLDDSDKQLLESINTDMYNAASKRLDKEKFKKHTGKTLEEVFDMSKRQNENAVWLNAEQMVAIGLVKQENVLQIDSSIAAELNKKDFISMFIEPEKKEENKINNNLNITTMTEQEIQARIDSEVKAQVEAFKSSESQRVANWLIWADVDSDAVIAGVQSGEAISVEKQKELKAKIANNTELTAIENNSNGAIQTGQDSKEQAQGKSAEQLQAEANEKEVFALLNLKDGEDK